MSLRINWLVKHNSIVNCEDKVVQSLDYLGNKIEICGFQKPVEVRKISTMQLKKATRKGYFIYAIQVNDLDNKKLYLGDYPILKEFQDVFLVELTKLPPKRDFDFTIKLLRGIEP